MNGRRVLPMLFAAALLFLRGGDCVSLLFADQQTRSCCTAGKCSKSAQKADPCCKVTSSDSARHYQIEAKFSGDGISAISLDALLDPMDLTGSLPVFDYLPLTFTLGSPPGFSGQLSPPLLI